VSGLVEITDGESGMKGGLIAISSSCGVVLAPVTSWGGRGIILFPGEIVGRGMILLSGEIRGMIVSGRSKT
jgi:hypothetical protein